MIVKIDPENPDCFWGGAPHWRTSETCQDGANQTFCNRRQRRAAATWKFLKP